MVRGTTARPDARVLCKQLGGIFNLRPSERLTSFHPPAATGTCGLTVFIFPLAELRSILPDVAEIKKSKPSGLAG